jgi:shikimate kinase
MGIILVGGLKHCGKTTLGRIIASDLEYRFYDMDDLILKETTGVWKTVRAIWREVGREEFMLLEEDAARNFVEWIIPDLKGQGCVLSLGGGTVENEGAMAWIGGKGTNVYVRADQELLYGRIMAKGRPPFLSEDNPREDFAALYEKRHRLYTEYAHLIHDVDDSPAKINAQRLLVALEKYHAR